MIDLRQGDCLELMNDIPDGSVDLTITSPPYDNLRVYRGNITQWNFDKFKSIAKELYRITSLGGVVVWIVNDATLNGSETGTSFKQALYFKECGFNLHDTMIWYKENCQFPDKIRYYSSFEYMFVFSKGKPKTTHLLEDRKNKWSGTKVHGTARLKNGDTKPHPSVRLKNNRKIKEFGVRYNTWRISPEKNNKTGHPAVFPVQLVVDHIVTWSREGDTVLDCFMGSGTTGVACVTTGRSFIGMELDPHYFDIASQRIRKSQEEFSKIARTM